MFFGTEEPRVAAAAIQAGARAVIRVDASDPVTTLATAVLLVLRQVGRTASGEPVLPARAGPAPVQAPPPGMGVTSPAGREMPTPAE